MLTAAGKLRLLNAVQPANASYMIAAADGKLIFSSKEQEKNMDCTIVVAAGNSAVTSVEHDINSEETKDDRTEQRITERPVVEKY